MAIQSVYCLCAAWCDTCTAFRGAFDEAAAAHSTLRFEWIDIEDEADLVDDVDIETFPTILALDEAGGVAFCGPIRPQRGHLDTVIASPGGGPQPAAIVALGARLARRELDQAGAR